MKAKSRAKAPMEPKALFYKHIDDFSGFMGFLLEAMEFADKGVKARSDNCEELDAGTASVVAVWAAGVWFRSGRWADVADGAATAKPGKAKAVAK